MNFSKKVSLRILLLFYAASLWAPTKQASSPKKAKCVKFCINLGFAITVTILSLLNMSDPNPVNTFFDHSDFKKINDCHNFNEADSYKVKRWSRSPACMFVANHGDCLQRTPFEKTSFLPESNFLDKTIIARGLKSLVLNESSYFLVKMDPVCPRGSFWGKASRKYHPKAAIELRLNKNFIIYENVFDEYSTLFLLGHEFGHFVLQDSLPIKSFSDFWDKLVEGLTERKIRQLFLVTKAYKKNPSAFFDSAINFLLKAKRVELDEEENSVLHPINRIRRMLNQPMDKSLKDISKTYHKEHLADGFGLIMAGSFNESALTNMFLEAYDVESNTEAFLKEEFVAHPSTISRIKFLKVFAETFFN